MLNELQLIKINRHGDHRGYFAETYSRREYLNLGIDVDFVQDNHSFSREAGTLRGTLSSATACSSKTCEMWTWRYF